MGSISTISMGADDEGPGEAPMTVLMKAEKIAQQISELAADPDVNDTSVEGVVQVVKRAMAELAGREKILLGARVELTPVTPEVQEDAGPGDALIDKPVHTDPDAEENLQNRHRDLCYLLMLNVMILIYIFAFGCLFTYLERDNDWTLIDGWFFAVVTIGTVGYGVLIPGNQWTMAVVVIYLVLGCVFFIFSMSLVTDVLLGALEEAVKSRQLHKYTLCGPRVLGLVTVLTAIITSGILYGVIGENWSFLEALYWTVVTITTVGYGDYAPTTQVGRVIVSIFILLGCGAFAAILAGVVASYISIRHRAAALLFMMGALTEEKLSKMPRNKKGQITRTEFCEHMLVKLSYIAHEDLDLIHDCFDAIDVDGSGSLDITDVTRSAEGKVLLEKMRLAHGISPGDRNMLPLGFFGIRFTFVKEKVVVDPELSTRLMAEAKRSAQAPDTAATTPEPSIGDSFASLKDAVSPSAMNDQERLAALEARKDE